MALRAALRPLALAPGSRPPRRTHKQQQGPAAPQLPRGAPKHPLQHALAALAGSLLPQGPASQAAQQQEQAVQEPQPGGEQPCPVVSPPDPAAATRREISKLSDLLLWGLAVALVCVCCPVGLLFSVMLSLGGAALALLLTFPEVLLQVASTAGLEVWSMLAGLDFTSLALGLGLTVVKAAKTLWILGLDVWSLVLSIAIGAAKLGAALVLGVLKIGKAALLAGLDVWSVLVGGVVGGARAVRAALAALAGRGRRGGGDAGGGDASGSGEPSQQPRTAAP